MKNSSSSWNVAWSDIWILFSLFKSSSPRIAKEKLINSITSRNEMTNEKQLKNVNFRTSFGGILNLLVNSLSISLECHFHNVTAGNQLENHLSSFWSPFKCKLKMGRNSSSGAASCVFLVSNVYSKFMRDDTSNCSIIHTKCLCLRQKKSTSWDKRGKKSRSCQVFPFLMLINRRLSNKMLQLDSKVMLG